MTANPIAMREIRSYRRTVPLWTQRADTIGIVAVALAISAFLIIRWLLERPNAPTWLTYHLLLNFDTPAAIQIGVWVIYAGLLIRCTAAGVSAAHRYQRQSRDDIFLTGVAGSTLIFGQWRAALFQVRGWMLALGVVRIAATVVMMAEYQFNMYGDLLRGVERCCSVYGTEIIAYHPWQIPLAFSFALVLGLIEVWATTGVGILAGTWFRQPAIAWIVALFVRLLPIAIFSWFPTFFSPSNPYDVLSIRWIEYTWFAFADGGTGAMLRLTLPGNIQYWGNFVAARGLIAFFAAFHMLLLFGIGAFLLTRWRLRWLGVSSAPLRLPRITLPSRSDRLENLAVMIGGLGVSIALMLIWSGSMHAVPGAGRYVPDNPAFLDWVQAILICAISAVSLRAMIAGVSPTHKRYASVDTVRGLLSVSWKLSNRLRGWFFALNILWMTVFALLIMENWVNNYSATFLNCFVLQYRYTCSVLISWQPSQWILALAFPLLLTSLILFSSAALGVAAARLTRSSGVALLLAFILRETPLILGSFPPDVWLPQNYSSMLITRWHQDFMMILGDTGITAFIGILKPNWHTGDVMGLNNIGYGILAFLLVIYMLIGYILLSATLIRLKSLIR